MTQKKTWYNIALWIVLYLFWILVFQKRAFAFSKTMTIQFCYLLFIAANYYFNIYFTIPAFLYKKKYAAFALLFLAGIIAASLLRVPLATYLSLHYFAPGKTPPAFSELLINSFTNIFIWTICLVAGKLIIDRIRFQKYIDMIEKEKIKNELDFLKAQFNPHFLFNSINSIYGNIDKGNATARNMLLTFSDMLRYQLYDCNSNAINIEKEMNYIRNYVALQKARKEETVIIDLHIGENLAGFSIAPLLFIAFIENSFKYVGSNEDMEHRVFISLMKAGNTFYFNCRNTKEMNIAVNGDHKGIGVANAQRRVAV